MQCGKVVAEDLGGSSYGAIVDFPDVFSVAPVMMYSPDESFNGNGGTDVNAYKEVYKNNAMLRTNNTVDKVHWLGMEPGTHTVSGKQIVAGRVDDLGNGETITFASPFSSPPIVLVMHRSDGSVYNLRTHTITNTDVSIWSEAGGSGTDIFYIAMEQGDYENNDYRWVAESFANPDTNDDITFPGTLNANGQVPFLYHTVNDTNNSGATKSRTNALTDTNFTIWMDNNNSEFLHWMAVVKK